MLVEVSGAHGVPAVELGDGRKVDEPVHLDGLPEVARRVGGDPAADVGYLEELGLALLVLFLGCHLLGEVGVALREDDDRVAGDVHALELLVLGCRLGVVDEVELRAGFGDLFLHVERAFMVDGVVERGVAERALFAEFGEGAGLVELVPGFGHTLEEFVSHAAAAPVGLDFLLVDVHVGAGDGVVLLRARREDFKVVAGVAGELREGRDGLREGAALSDYELVLAYVKRFVLAEVLEVRAAEDGHRELAFVLAVELGLKQSPFDGNAGVLVEAGVAEPLHALARRSGGLLYLFAHLTAAAGCFDVFSHGCYLLTKFRFSGLFLNFMGLPAAYPPMCTFSP